MPSIVNTFAEISDQYDVAFVDLGCMHNGITPFQASVDAMQSYRERGGKVVLVTNSRVRGTVLQQLLTWNGALLDAIATSGDSARAAMFHGFVGSENLVHGGNTTTRRFL
jgi:ribonucleotide monophosphatase NagD (HAD superfamily)